MSLHIGNLSSHIHRDDLERVFRRFGRCTVQVKDKYGFVVYDYPASAEKALKTLRGIRICGETISISWSKMQPRASQRFARGGKSYEPPPRRRYSVLEYSNRKPTSNDRQHDYEINSKKLDDEVRNVDESVSYHIDGSKGYLGERDFSYPNNHCGTEGSGKNHPEDDRWGEQVVDQSNETYLENSMEFDRYEPYQGDVKKDLDDHSDDTSSRSQSPRSLRSLYRAPSPSKLKSVCLKKIFPSSNIRQKDTKVSVANAVGFVQSDRGGSKYEHIASVVVNECAKLERKDSKKDCSEKNNENSLRSNTSNSARISSEELHTVLKHYGLQYRKENEKGLPVETYFGSARLWPWQIIYYRGLKKGLILADNYKRRIAQNQEFGIVDKYIRSSSGWGELNKNNL